MVEGVFRTRPVASSPRAANVSVLLLDSRKTIGIIFRHWLLRSTREDRCHRSPLATYVES